MLENDLKSSGNTNRDHFQSFLLANYKPILEAFHDSHSLLWRGADREFLKPDPYWGPGVWEMTPPTNRKSKDSNQFAHTRLSELQQMAGWPLTRSTSLFATSDYDQLGPYGTHNGVLLPDPDAGFFFAWNELDEDRVYQNELELYSGDFKDGLGAIMHPDDLARECHLALKEIEHVPELRQSPAARTLIVSHNTLLGMGGAKSFGDMVAAMMDAIQAMRDLEKLSEAPLNLYQYSAPLQQAARVMTTRRLYKPAQILENLGWNLGNGYEDFKHALVIGHEIMIRGQCLWIDEGAVWHQPDGSQFKPLSVILDIVGVHHDEEAHVKTDSVQGLHDLDD